MAQLATFEIRTPLGAHRRVGGVVDGRVVDLNLARRIELAEAGAYDPARRANLEVPADMISFFEAGQLAMDHARALLARWPSREYGGAGGERPVWHVEEVRLLAPLPRPLSIRDFSTFYHHALGWGGGKRREGWFQRPSAYKGNPASVIGPDDPLSWPRYTDQLDLELELACLIGRRGRDIPADRALEHVAGYTILVDASARDAQRLDRLGPYKGKDFCNVLGPVLVTPDEFDPRNATCAFRVDGEVWWSGNLSEPRQFQTEDLIAYASEEEELFPGDVIGSGTVGLQCSLDTDRWVAVGQMVEFEIEGIGVLRHRIVESGSASLPSLVRNGLGGHLDYKFDADGFAFDVRQRID